MTRKMTKNIFGAAMLLFASATSVQAQDSALLAALKAIKISGSVDGYYRYNFDNNVGGGVLGNNSSTSFASAQSTFQLGMASIKAEYTQKKGGVVVDLGFGPRAEEFSYADAGTLMALKQAYLYYAPSDKVKFTFGKFGTHVGYELLDPQLNKNYTMSYMFTNGPFSHTGLKADFSLGKGFGAMIGIANPIDVTSPTDGSIPKTLIAQVSHVGEKASVYLNYAGYFGAKIQMPTESSTSQIGLTASYTVSDKFSLGYDGTIKLYKDDVADKSYNWFGSALYFNYLPSSCFGLTLRGEYFGDKYGYKVPSGVTVANPDGGNNILALTLSGNYKVGGFTLIPEIRLDNASEDGLYLKKNGASTKSTVSAILAAIYSF